MAGVDGGLQIVLHILRAPGLQTQNTSFVYSRDLRPDNFKHGNVVLLGTYESTPWVQMFEPGMNFFFRNGLNNGVFAVVNRHPQPGEQAQYASVAGDPQNVVYGLVAYRPSLCSTMPICCRFAEHRAAGRIDSLV